MKVKDGQQAPDFKVKDLDGNTIWLQQFVGRKVHLVFYRFAGCPFCNLRFHQIDQLADAYRKSNTVLISVYESSAENMRDMMADEKFYSIMIPNSDSSLYQLYDLDRSTWGLFKYLFFGGGLADVMKGMKLFKKKVKNDGHTDRIEAEFLIDENGKVVNAHYGEIPGQFIPIAEIKNFVQA